MIGKLAPYVMVGLVQTAVILVMSVVLFQVPLGGGWLTGKYARDSTPTGATRLGDDPGRGMEAYGPRNSDARTWHILDAVRHVGSVIRVLGNRYVLSNDLRATGKWVIVTIRPAEAKQAGVK